MNGKHLMASGQVVIAENKKNTLLIHEHKRFLDTLQSPFLLCIFHFLYTVILYFDMPTFLSHIEFTKAIFVANKNKTYRSRFSRAEAMFSNSLQSKQY